jgi:hypothetical protein
MSDLTTAPSELTTHARLRAWVDEIAALTQPDAVHWCDGSAEEYDALAQALIDAGTFERLSDAKRQTPPTSPGSKTAPLSAPSRRRTRARPTTGAIQRRCGRR